MLGAFSLLVSGAWQVRSYWTRDYVRFGRGAYLTSESGRLMIVFYQLPGGGLTLASRTIDQPRRFLQAEMRKLDTLAYGGTGVRWDAVDVGFRGDSFSPLQVEVIVPHALMGCVLAVPGIVIWLWSVRSARRRAEEGLCARCGYDLRHLDSSRCPECGTEISPTAATRCPSPVP